jgi:hypothetical protein
MQDRIIRIVRLCVGSIKHGWVVRASSRTVKSGVERIALATEKLNHREDRGGAEDTGKALRRTWRIGIPGFIWGWTIYNVRENGDRILLGDRHGSDRRRRHDFRRRLQEMTWRIGNGR